MVEHIIVAAILCILAAGVLVYAVWTARDFWRRHLARRRPKRQSIVGIGESVTHRLPSVEERPLNYHTWWTNDN